MDKFEQVRQQGTNGQSYELTTEDIVTRLKNWDSKYGISLSEISSDGLIVSFDVLPSNLQGFAEEIYEFCPDVVDQHFGCFGEMIEIAGELGQELDSELTELTEGINLEDESSGVELLARSLKKTKTLALWWD